MVIPGLLVLSGYCTNAQVFHESMNSVYLTGGAYSQHFTDAFSFTANPSVLGLDRNMLLAVSTEDRWMLKELAYYQGAFSLPAGKGGLGMYFHFSGDPDYSESGISIGYGKDLGKISLGIQCAFDQEHVSYYGSRSYGSAGFGMLVHLNEKVLAGLTIGNTFLDKTAGSNPERGSGDFTMGFGYEISPEVFVSLQLRKSWDLPLEAIVSLDYRFAASFFATLGIASGSSSPYVKAGWEKGLLSVAVFTAYEIALGFTPGLVILWELKKK